MIKIEVQKLRDTIEENIDYLSREFETTNEVLSDLNRMISLDMNSSLMFQWWVKNEKSIHKINELLKR